MARSDWTPEVYAVVLPDPLDLDAPWIDTATFTTKAEVDHFVTEILGGDAKGRIGLLSRVQDHGWVIDLPDPRLPEEAWIEVGAFDRKIDALKFVKEKFGADSQGRLKAFDIMYTTPVIEPERGPRDWSPRWEK